MLQSRSVPFARADCWLLGCSVRFCQLMRFKESLWFFRFLCRASATAQCSHPFAVRGPELGQIVPSVFRLHHFLFPFSTLACAPVALLRNGGTFGCMSSLNSSAPCQRELFQAVPEPFQPHHLTLKAPPPPPPPPRCRGVQGSAR